MHCTIELVDWMVAAVEAAECTVRWVWSSAAGSQRADCLDGLQLDVRVAALSI